MIIKHTPGPWILSQDGEFIMAADGSASIVETGLYKIDNIRQTFADLRQPCPEQVDRMEEWNHAYARLIAAAPELFDSLRRVMRHIPADAGGASLGDDMCRAQKAIDKALGKI